MTQTITDEKMVAHVATDGGGLVMDGSGADAPQVAGQGSRISKKALKVTAAAATAALTAAVGWVVKETAPLATDKITNQPILRASAQYDKAWLADGWSIVSSGPLDPQAVPATVTTCESLRDWLTENEGADFGASHLRLHLEGARSQTATVTDLRAHVVSRSAPRNYGKITCPSAGEQSAQRVKLNLDQRAPSAASLNDKGEVIGPYFQLHTVTLNKGEPLEFVIEAETRTATVTWQLELDVQIGKETKTVVVAEPVFVTTAVQPPEAYAEQWQWRWDLQPQRLERQASRTGTPATTTSTAPANASAPSVPARLRPAGFTASGFAPPAVDASGRPVSYEPRLVGDDDPGTAWRTSGDGTNQWLELTFNQPTSIQRLGLLPGYSKIDAADRTDRFKQNRRVSRVRYVFDGGHGIIQGFTDRAELQLIALDTPVLTRRIRVEILNTTAPGDADFDFTAISEIVVFGRQ